MLVFNRGDVLVHGLYGGCFAEVIGGMCYQALEVVAVDGARVFGGVEFVDILAVIVGVWASRAFLRISGSRAGI